MKDYTDNKGITIITLIVTVILIAIISSVAVYNATSLINDSKKVAFISELNIIQGKLNIIYEKIEVGQDIENYKNEGKKIELLDDNLKSKIDKVNQEIYIYDLQNYLYFDNYSLENIGVYGLNGDYLINFKIADVININGIKIEGELYYRAEEMNVYNKL